MSCGCCGTAQAPASRGNRSGARAWLARGEGRGDWRVAEVGRDRVTVVQGERRYVATFLGPAATLRPVGARPVVEAEPALRR